MRHEFPKDPKEIEYWKGAEERKKLRELEAKKKQSQESNPPAQTSSPELTGKGYSSEVLRTSVPTLEELNQVPSFGEGLLLDKS